MRWKVKSELPCRPGENVVIEKFAWLPVRLDDDTMIWFEKYNLKLQMQMGFDWKIKRYRE